MIVFHIVEIIPPVLSLVIIVAAGIELNLMLPPLIEWFIIDLPSSATSLPKG
jgi:hypothetical protein